MSTLRQKARRHGTRSLFAGDEPRCHEITDHWPKRKAKRQRFTPLPKRLAKLKRKDRTNKQADAANYRARLTSPWPLYEKGGPDR